MIKKSSITDEQISDLESFNVSLLGTLYFKLSELDYYVEI